MKTVWKYQIRPDSNRDAVYWLDVVDVPRGSKPLCVMMQNGVPCVWFEVETTEPKGPFRLYSVGTGFGKIPEGVTYLGSIIEDEYVWHIYY